MDFLDDLKIHFPYYLARPETQFLHDAIKDFSISSNNLNYYLDSNWKPEYMKEMLQGDIWSNFVVYNFEMGKEINGISGIVLSNSCDIAPENLREIPVKVTFCPIVKLSLYEELLRKKSSKIDSIEDKLKSLREQKISSMFYLPIGGNIMEECFVNFNDIHSIDYNNFISKYSGNKKITLNLFGFYLLTFKLSIHFCRMGEKVERVPSIVTT